MFFRISQKRELRLHYYSGRIQGGGQADMGSENKAASSFSLL
jgi:hypothetical protein